MLFTITWDQYQRYKDTVEPCRQYILDKFSRLCSVVDTFNRYFGAENVDIYASGFSQKSLLLTLLETYEQRQNAESVSIQQFLNNIFNNTLDTLHLYDDLAIYVHWDSVTVTNEKNHSVIVTDLYAKVPMYSDGRLRSNFTLTRSSYSYEQYISGYMHSHVQGIDRDPSMFKIPCLGTGPLINTQGSLRDSVDNDLWDLFCVELDRYVHVESISGVPYRYLDRIGTEKLVPLQFDGNKRQIVEFIACHTPIKKLFERFFRYVIIRKKMRFSYSGGIYKSAYGRTEWILKLSKSFLKYFALMRSLEQTDVTIGTLLSESLIMTVKMSDNTLYTLGSRSRLLSYQSFQNQHVLFFKGEDIRTHVDEPANYSENTYYVLNPLLAFTFLDQCLNYLNIYEHEKSKNVIQENQQEGEVISGSTSDSTSGHTSKVTFKDYPFGEKRVLISV